MNGGPTVASIPAAEGEISHSAQLGNCYLAGMGMGVWWGLIAAVVFFLWSMTVFRAGEFGRYMPIILTVCAMNVALGALLYGVIGLIGGSTDDAETMCGNLGLLLGLFAAFAPAIGTVGFILYTGLPTFVGCTWVSRQMGKALGARINEWRSSVFVVSGAGGVAMTHSRR